MRSAGTTGNSKQQFFSIWPPKQPGGILPKARERRLPELPERNPPATAEVPVDQVNNVQTCTYLQPFNNKFQTYFCVTFQGSGADTYSDDRPTPSRKASSFLSEFVCDNSGLVSPKHGTGVSNRFCVGATPTILPTPPHHSSARSQLI